MRRRYPGGVRLLGGKNDPGESVTAGEPAPETSVGRAHTPGKGRPTPSRREARGVRLGPTPPPPRNQRESLRRARRTRKERGRGKAGRRAQQATRRERMMAGDERYLPSRDRGPDKAYARDVVDARRSVMTMFMPLTLLVVIGWFIPSPGLKQLALLVFAAMLLIIVVEGLLLGRTVNRRVRARFPDTATSRLGLGYYAFTRATQPRRLRIPKPRVAAGASV